MRRSFRARITSGTSMPTMAPIMKTVTYSTVRKGAAIQVKVMNSSAAETPPIRPTASSMSTKRASTSSSRTYFDRWAPTPIANR